MINNTNNNNVQFDELAEQILDCIMNSHYIPINGRNYVEKFVPS